MSPLLMYIAEGPNPSRSTLTYSADAEPVVHGEVFSVDDAEALTSDPATAALLKEVETDYNEKSRTELEEMARDAGVSNPDDFDQYPTEGTLAVAIEQAGEPEEQPAEAASPPVETAPEPQPEEGQ